MSTSPDSTPGPVDLACVALGAALGAVARWGLGEVAPTVHGVTAATLVINVVGAFALGALPALAVVRRSRRVALLLGPGLLGGFTTVSAWIGESTTLARDGHVGLAGLYIAATVAAGITAAALGRAVASRRAGDS